MLPGFDAQRNILQRRAIATHNRNIFKFQQRRHALVYRQQHPPRNRSNSLSAESRSAQLRRHHIQHCYLCSVLLAKPQRLFAARCAKNAVFETGEAVFQVSTSWKGDVVV